MYRARAQSEAQMAITYILDRQNVNSTIDQLLRKVQVVLEVVFAVLLGVCDVARVADCSFNDSSGLLGSIDSQSHVLNVIERIENSEDIKSILDSSSGELCEGVEYQFNCDSIS